MTAAAVRLPGSDAQRAAALGEVTATSAARPTPIRRAHLLRILGQAVPGDTIRIQAPAGYGKTTLLAQYGSELRADGGFCVAQLSLDARHADPDVLAAALGDALASAGLAGASQFPGRDWTGVVDDVTEILVRAGRPVALLVDNVERLAASGAGAVMERLLQARPSPLIVATAGAGWPGATTGVFCAGGRRIDVGAAELAFELEESTALLEGVISAEHIVTLHEGAEGWPLGLQLACDRYAGRGVLMLPASELADCVKQVAAAYTEESFDRLSPETQAALQESCVLDDFDAELLDAFLGRGDSHRLVEEARRTGALLRPAEGDRAGWRLHRLARVHLHDAMSRRLGPSAVARLNARAAEHRRARGEFSAALTHAARAGDAGLALDIFEQAGGLGSVAHIGYAGLRTLCSILPEGLLERSPCLGLARAISFLAAGLPPAGRHAFERARAAVSPVAGSVGDPDMDLGLAQQVFELYAAAYGDRAVGEDFVARLERMVDDPGRQSLAFRLVALKFLVMRYQQCGELVRATHRISEFSRTQMLAKVRAFESNIPAYQGLIAFARGELDLAESHFRSIGSNLTLEGQITATYVAARVFLAEVKYERNEVEAAASILRASMPHLERIEGWFDTYAAAYGLAARLAFHQGEPGLARGHCEALRDVAARRGSERLRRLADAYEAELLCRLEATADLPALVGDRRRLTVRLLAAPESIADASWREDDVLSYVAVQWSMAAGDHEAADSLLEAHCARARRQGRRPALLKGLLLRALLEQRRGRSCEALEALQAAIPKSAEAGLQRTWLDEGEPLRRLVRRGLAAGLAAGLTPAQAAFLGVRDEAAPAQTGQLLTQREYDVLGELSVGQSNKQIGRRLGMSENTVKTHLKSLFGKLQVDRRRQAIDVARARGLA